MNTKKRKAEKTEKEEVEGANKKWTGSTRLESQKEAWSKVLGVGGPARQKEPPSTQGTPKIKLRKMKEETKRRLTPKSRLRT